MSIIRQKVVPMPKIKRYIRQYEDFYSFDEPVVKDKLLPCEYAFNVLLKKSGNEQGSAWGIPFGNVLSSVGSIYGMALYNGVNNDQMLVASASGIYSVECKTNSTARKISTEVFSKLFSVQMTINGEACILLFDGSKFLTYNGSVVSAVELPVATGMCVLKNRMFLLCAGERRLYFSAPDSLTDFSSAGGGGYIELDPSMGNAEYLFVLKGSIYLFCHFKIFRIDVVAEREEFVLEEILATYDTIIANTLYFDGETACFVTKNGIFRFDGKKVVNVPIRNDVKELFVSTRNTFACIYKGRYYFSFVNNNKLYTFYCDMQTGEGCFQDYLISYPVVYNGNIYYISSNRIVNLTIAPKLSMIWRSKQTDFGIKERKKLLREIKTDGNETYLVTVFCDGVNKGTYTLNGTDKVKVCLQANKYQLEFNVNGINVTPDRLTLTFDAWEGSL